ncbi:hypothetical protein [Streptomyces sp. Ncost-T10-10d]|uniref:hypothetical protein n=1 Tax=Streptomyces sp. Ncost-T10-10d TaxID=1839774 RepID=UPI00081F6F02|nr:Secreted repeat of unknown function [Streptomyces sp. Ncost-T10-10d]
MRSARTGARLSKWPVVAASAKKDIKGVTTKGFVTFDRPDGIKQQAIGCWPVYTYFGDVKPEDTSGQGIGSAWYAVSPDAKPVGAPEWSDSASPRPVRRRMSHAATGRSHMPLVCDQ